MKFVPAESTALTTADAIELELLEVSGVFIDQKKEESFRIGNESITEAHYQITTSGLNTTINDDVEYSTDSGVTFETTATVSGIQPNQMSERIIVRYTPEQGELLGVGSFLIRVDEI